MTPDDRYQIVSEDGLIATTHTRAEAFRIGEKCAEARQPGIYHGIVVEVFDCMAHVGAPECWRYLYSAGWVVIDRRAT